MPKHITPRPEDIPSLVGREFGFLTVLDAPAIKNWDGKWCALCRCRCGNVSRVALYNLATGKAVGCARSAFGSHPDRHPEVGRGRPAGYGLWQNMIGRCHNPESHGYRYYGARGIVVCDRWRQSFDAFMEDMGPRPEGHSIDRIDNSRGYEPGNCRWATPKEQANNRRSNRLLTLHGETRTLTQWTEATGIGCMTIHKRLLRGWSVEAALTTPVKAAVRPRFSEDGPTL